MRRITQAAIAAALIICTFSTAEARRSRHYVAPQYQQWQGWTDHAAQAAYPLETAVTVRHQVRHIRVKHHRRAVDANGSRATRSSRAMATHAMLVDKPQEYVKPNHPGEKLVTRERYEGTVTIPIDSGLGEDAGYADGIAYTAPQTEVDAARAYVIKTAHAGGVMARMGRELYLAKLRGYAGSFNLFGVFKTALESGNIEQIGIEQNVAALNPKFVVMAAKAIRAARARGIDVGLFSGYRPPNYGVGGFANKFESCHTYALAGDFWGVEKNYAIWVKAAREAGLHRPYSSPRERNHWQAVPDKTCLELRSTVIATGPKSLSRMWAAADRMIDRAHRPTRYAEIRRHKRYARHHHRGYRIARR